MSGSPVYVDGRLMGAVSYSLGQFSTEAIAGITPIAEMLDGKDLDDATLKRTSEIMAAGRELHVEKKPEIPESLRGPEVPDPSKA